MQSSCTLANKLRVQGYSDCVEVYENTKMYTSFEQTFEASRQRRFKLQQKTGDTEQLRIKNIADIGQLKSPKLFQKILQITKWFIPSEKTFATFQEACAELRKQIDPVKNTLVRDNKRLFQSLLTTQKNLVQSGDEEDLLDPIDFVDTCSIAVE